MIFLSKDTAKRTAKGQKSFLSQILIPIAIGCFAYIGFAVGAVIVFFLSSTDIDFSSAADDAQSQRTLSYVLLITLLPAAIIAFAIPQNYKKPETISLQ